MNLAFVITICTLILGFLGTILTVISLINGLRSELKSDINKLETRFESNISELKEDINKLETRFEDDVKELRGLIIGLYSPNLIKQLNKNDKDVA